MTQLLEKAIENSTDILKTNYKIKKENKICIIYDNLSELSKLLKQAFEQTAKNLKNEFETIEFSLETSEKIVETIENNYKKEDIIILIQSNSFRVSKYRWRNELCEKGLKVAEFGHLEKMQTEKEYNNYINSLTTDFKHYENISKKIIPLIENSKTIKFISEDGSTLEYKGSMDKCIRNTGALWEQTNWTTRFPIGEIISEGKDLSILNGELEVYAFPSIDKQITTFVKPFKCTIKNGFLTSHTGPKEFEELIEMIKTENPKKLVYVRELGLGLNRNIKRHDMISDPIAYERQEGLHFSLGMKHGMYQKKLWKEYGKKFYQRYHIDIYVNINKIFIDDLLIFTKKKGYF